MNFKLLRLPLRYLVIFLDIYPFPKLLLQEGKMPIKPALLSFKKKRKNLKPENRWENSSKDDALHGGMFFLNGESMLLDIGLSFSGTTRFT